jgi:hypothetical protein
MTTVASVSERSILARDRSASALTLKARVAAVATIPSWAIEDLHINSA